MARYEVTQGGHRYEVTAPDHLSEEEVKALVAKQQDVNPLVDAARAVPGGLAKGVAAVVGLPGDVGHLMNVGMDKLTGQHIADMKTPLQFGSQDVNDAVEKVTGGYYQPKTTAGRYAETAASFVPGLFGGEASLGSRALTRVLAPAAGSMAAGSMVDEKEHPYLHTAAQVAGALGAGGLTHFGGKAAARAGERVLAAREAPEVLAGRKLAALLEKQGITPEQLAAGAIQGRGQLTAEALGPSGVTMAGTLGRQSGTTGAELAKVLKARSGTAIDRILADAEQASGVAPGQAAARIEDIVKTGRANAKPLYEAAESAPANTSEYLERFAQDPDVRQGMATGVRNAQRRALAENKPFDPNSYAVTAFNEAGDPIIGGVPTWKTWDAAKGGLDEALEKFRNPITRQLEMTPTASAIDDVRSSMLKEIDSLNPAYAKARAGAADYMSANAAFRDATGHLMNPKASAATVEKYFNGLNDANKEAYRAGLADKLHSLTQNARNFNPSSLLTRAIKSKITTAFGQEKGGQFIKALQDEADLAASAGRMKPGTGSFTFEGTEMAKDVDHLASFEAATEGAKAAGNLLRGNVVGGIVSGVKAARHFAPDLLRSRGLTEPARNELGRLLMLSPEEAAMELSRLPPKQRSTLSALLNR